MARCTAIGLWLLTAGWLLAVAGCTTDQTPTAKSEEPSKQAESPKQDETPKPQTLSEQALGLWQYDIEQYRLHTKDPESLRPQAEEFMRIVQLSMLPHPRGPGAAKTAEMGKQLFEQGCKDPLLKLYYGKAISNDRGSYFAMFALVEGLNTITKAGYPPECRRIGVFTLFGEAKRYARMLSWSGTRDEAAAMAAWRVGNESLGPEMQRLVFYELSPLIENNTGRDWEDAVAVYEACSKQPNADPWTLHMIAGRAYVAQAWHHRGGDLAYKVTPEGWKLFSENLRKAAGEYTEALKLHPDYPEAASEMIGVALGGESELTPQEWFEKTVAIEIDYMPAYCRMRWVLRPRWFGSLDEMYRFGCQCADTRRYDTEVPLMLMYVIGDMEEESGYSGKVWSREGAYARVKQVLEGMANEPSRDDESGVYPRKSCVMTIHAIMAGRANQYAEARRLVDELGDRLNRPILDAWCAHPESELAGIHAYGGPAADDLNKAFQTLAAAPRPISDEALQEVKSCFQKALAADDNERTKALARCWIDDMDGRLAFGAGEWFEKKFDPKMLGWCMAGGRWSMEDDDSAIGRTRGESSQILLRPNFTPVFPLEVEFDVETIKVPHDRWTLGLFLPDAGSAVPGGSSLDQFFVRTQDNQAGITIDGATKTAACELKPVNRLRVQIADGYAALHVNDQFCLDYRNKDFRPVPAFNFGCNNYVYPDRPIRISNIRFRKWEPPKEEVVPEKTMQEEDTSKEKMPSDPEEI